MSSHLTLLLVLVTPIGVLIIIDIVVFSKIDQPPT
jgi:hypothetical protein